ncbi:MAG: hypothetical protein V1933_01165 [Candidatus Omnitrophota bacterium]
MAVSEDKQTLILRANPPEADESRSSALVHIHSSRLGQWPRSNSIKFMLQCTTIAALALLIATSHPREKDMMIRIVTNLLK